MRSLGGLILLAGIGVGLFVYLPAPVNRETSVQNSWRPVATSTTAQKQPPQTRAAVEPVARSFSPKISLAAVARDIPSVVRPVASSGWETTSATIDNQYHSLEPTSPESRYQLVVDLQQQLKRVGCYYGRIDGSWGPGSKDAMQTFMTRVNATLPSDQPDYLLLTLLKSQSSKVCGACPADQLQLPGGRCLPRATVAYGQSSDPTTGATGAAEVLPWRAASNASQSAAKPVFKPLPTSVVSTEPLPGRMAIGGPSALPPINSVYAPSATTGNAQVPLTTATAAGPGVAPVASEPPASKPSRSYAKSRHRNDGPGTPHYNLMLSLGGVY
jgi:hypothetical protein